MDQVIFDQISLWYPEMIRQAKIKLNFRYCEDDSAHIELVDSVLAPFLTKVKSDPVFLKKMTSLMSENKLFLYLIKAIDSNAKFPSSPYLRSKIKLRRFKRIEDELNLSSEAEDISDQIEIENKLDELLTDSAFDDMFGRKMGFFYLELIRAYSKPHSTYKSIAEYYGISKSAVAAAIMVIKARLKEELESYVQNKY